MPLETGSSAVCIMLYFIVLYCAVLLNLYSTRTSCVAVICQGQSRCFFDGMDVVWNYLARETGNYSERRPGCVLLTKAVERGGHGSHFSRIGYTDVTTSSDDELWEMSGKESLSMKRFMTSSEHTVDGWTFKQ